MILKNILKSLQDAGELVFEKAVELNDTATEKFNDLKDQTKEKAVKLMEDWVQIIPKIREMGFELASFGTAASLSPSLNAEFTANPLDFTDDRLQPFLEKYKDDRSVNLFLTVVQTAIHLHMKTNAPMPDIMYIRLEVKFSPEIKVYLGKPNIF